MSKLSEIVNGWSNYVFPNKEVEALATQRMKICLDCTKLKDNNKCAICGCYCPAKVRSVQSSCPLKKW